MYLSHYKKETPAEKLAKKDLPYVIGMVILDIIAPIFLMLGIEYGTSSVSSLLGNFEIVATSLIALLVFKEKINLRLWLSIGLIVVASSLLSLDFTDNFTISIGSLFVLLATVCCGFENNCTRMISAKSSYQIVTIKGICSGVGSFAIALICGEKMPNFVVILEVLLLGYVAYGLSIFMYIKAQKNLGAAKTSAFYAVAPFIGAFLAFLIVGEKLDLRYFIALLIMIVGTIFVIVDILADKKRFKIND